MYVKLIVHWLSSNFQKAAKDIVKYAMSPFVKIGVILAIFNSFEKKPLLKIC